MISVIVPVYNVEAYLRKCLDSIVNQTYKDLEILVIDDGSTDGSKAICDEYARVDQRVKVFYAENCGLSSARNIGLDNARGEYIGFVDSDDWIERDMYEVLLKKAEKIGADVVECGVYIDYSKKTITSMKQEMITHGKDSLIALLRQDFSDGVWNKIWRKSCFEKIRFPIGRLFEDIAVTYRIIDTTKCVCSVPEIKYHYVQRKTSISYSFNTNNLMDYWYSCLERYEFLHERQDKDIDYYSLQACAVAIARAWAYYYKCNKPEREELGHVIHKMHSFSWQHFPIFGYKNWPIGLRIGIFFSHSCNCFSLRAAWLVNIIWKRVSGRKPNTTDYDVNNRE